MTDTVKQDLDKWFSSDNQFHALFPGDEPEFLRPLARREHLHAHEALRAIDEMRARAECGPDFFGLPIGDHEAAEDDEHG